MRRMFLRVICVPKHLLRSPKTGCISIVGTLVFTSVFAVTSGTAKAAVSTLREYAQPVVLTTSLERITVDADGTRVENGFGPMVETKDMVVLTDRRSIFATATDVVMLTEYGIPDIGFGTQGAVSGFNNITHIAVDETANRIYVLDSPASGTSTITSMSLTGFSKGSTSSPNTVAITAGESSLVALSPNEDDSLVYDLNLTTSRPLVFETDLPSLVGVVDAAWLNFPSGPGLAVADRTRGIVRRLSLVNLDSSGVVTAYPSQDAVPAPDVEFEAPVT